MARGRGGAFVGSVARKAGHRRAAWYRGRVGGGGSLVGWWQPSRRAVLPATGNRPPRAILAALVQSNAARCSLELIPSADERKWLGRYLRKLIERREFEHFVSTPILLPRPAIFPVQWNARIADVHRLTQHLMHYAGLGDLELRLTGFTSDDIEGVMDAGTAGWFAGIRDGRAHMGVHVAQLRDAEAAVGVMAHEVAHAWRAQHKLRADSRDREELLTDLSTIYLGFGVLTTNNTDRYRSSGGYGYTAWSTSSAGYLPPTAMAWLLALQIAARGDRRERADVESHLEPNQRASFRAAMKELTADPSWLEALALPSRSTWPPRRAIERVIVVEPDVDEVERAEPEPAAVATDRNHGVSLPRLKQSDLLPRLYFGAAAGAFLGMFIVFAIEHEPSQATSGITIASAIIAMVAFFLTGTRRFVCSDATCRTRVFARTEVCPGCGATLGRIVRPREQRRLAEEELERRAAEEFGADDCAECQPEAPCRRHAVQYGG